MLRKLLFLVGWMVASTGTLFFSALLLLAATQKTTSSQVLGEMDNLMLRETPELVYAAVQGSDNKIKTAIGASDARTEILRQYLEKYGSPLEAESELLVKVADENGFDFRWMVAIAQQESNLCKRIPENSYNCWGWGIYGDKVTRFDSYADAIRRIGPQFKQKFLHTGPNTEPGQVMKTYTPPSDGSWANGVNQFMGDME